MKLNYIPILVLLSVMCGCASLPQDVMLVVESTPSGSNVTSSSGWTCTTPCELKVERNSPFKVEFELDGHESQSQDIMIEKLRRSKVATFVGIGVGAAAGVATVDISQAMAEVLANAITDSFLSIFGIDSEYSGEIEKASSGERLKGAFLGASIYGSIGFGIDRLIDVRRSNAPHKISVVMHKSSSSLDEYGTDSSE